MTEIYYSKEYIREDAVRGFEHLHHASAEDIQVARAMVEQNLFVIGHFLGSGIVTQDRLEEIFNDDILQGTYSQMAMALDKGDGDTFEALNGTIKGKPDTLCGWLGFYAQYLEISLGLNLVPEELID